MPQKQKNPHETGNSKINRNLPPGTEKNLVLDVLYVLPDFRKLGVARSLINKIESIAKEQKLDLIIKGIEKSNLLAQKLFKDYQEVVRTRYIKKA